MDATDKTEALLESEVVEVSSWADMEDDPLFTNTIDPALVELGRAIGYYPSLLPLRKCCITSCHTEHGHGYFIELGDGTRSYVGHVCGIKHFPDLKSSARLLGKVNDRRIARQQLQRAQDYLDGLEPKIKKLIEDKARNIYHIMKPFVKSEKAPLMLVKRLKDMARSGERQVTVARLRSKQEQEDYKEAFPQAKGRDLTHETSVIGSIRGLKAINISKLSELVRVVADTRTKLSILDVDNESTQNIRKVISESEVVDDVFKEAKEVVADFFKFITEENVALMHHLVGGEEDKSQVFSLEFNSTEGWRQMGPKEAKQRRGSVESD